MAMGVQGKMIEAAARAGVKWILPTEYAGDGLNEGMVEAVPLFHPKREARRQIEELSKEKECEGVKWIGVATGPWVGAVSFADFLLPHSLGSIFVLLLGEEEEEVKPSPPSTRLIYPQSTDHFANAEDQNSQSNALSSP